MSTSELPSSYTPLRVLVISGLYPPNVVGGAEVSAGSLVRLLASAGMDVAVLTTAASPDQEARGEVIDGVRVWRVLRPRPYPMLDFPKAPAWKKPLWHLLDHVDPRNATLVADVIKDFKPDRINIHIAQGIGHNILGVVSRADVPVVYFLHDLGLLCLRQNMYKAGETCRKQCLPCRASSALKVFYVRKLRRLGLASPSRAVLEKVRSGARLHDIPGAVILDANRYPAPTVRYEPADHLRLLYVGRLHASKGTDLLFKVAARLAETRKFTLTVAGSGQDEARLRETYGQREWCKFLGFISHQEISDRMAESDVLCAPSIWIENSPGTVIQALTTGLPVLGSRIGGIPELVDDGRTGMLVEAGNETAWEDALAALIDDPSIVADWRRAAEEESHRFDPEAIFSQVIRFMDEVASTGRLAPVPTPIEVQPLVN